MNKNPNFLNAQNYTLNQKVVWIINRNYNTQINWDNSWSYVLIYIMLTTLVFIVSIFKSNIISYIFIGLIFWSIIYFYLKSRSSIKYYNCDIYTKKPMSSNFYLRIVTLDKNNTYDDDWKKYFYINK